MNSRVRPVILFCFCLSMLACVLEPARAAQVQATRAAEIKPVPVKDKSSVGLEAARTLSLVTGVAISPLLGVSAVGVYHWWQTPAEKRNRLPWFAQPWFWGPALFLLALVGFKDLFGSATPAALKKPFDAAEAIENKISGLIAAGLFIPLMISIFPTGSGDQSLLSPAVLGFASINFGAVGNALLTPFAILVFAVVWLASHTINVLILVSPFSIVDTALKCFRLLVLCIITAASMLSPYFGAILCAFVIIFSYFIAGWSFRLTVFGNLYLWDYLTFRSRRFQPGAESNWAFIARKSEGAPPRTFGRLVCAKTGPHYFVYRPWLVLAPRTLPLRDGTYFVGRGLLYPEIDRVQNGKTAPAFLLPPRYMGHEETVAHLYKFEGVRDVGMLKGLKAAWAWLKGGLASTVGAVASPQLR